VVVALAACAVLILHFHRLGLVALGGAAGLLAAVSFAVERAHRDRTAWGEVIGVLGLSTAIPLASYATTGSFDVGHAGLWALATLFFTGSVFHVRFLIRCWRRRRGPLLERLQAGWPSLAWHLGALALAAGAAQMHLVPAWAPVALVPVTLKALLTFRRGPDAPPVTRTIGFLELAHGLLFVGLALPAYRGAA
jgi:hypothetical protein